MLGYCLQKKKKNSTYVLVLGYSKKVKLEGLVNLKRPFELNISTSSVKYYKKGKQIEDHLGLLDFLFST